MVRRSTSHSSARSSRVMLRRASSIRMIECRRPAWEYFFVGLPFCMVTSCRIPIYRYNVYRIGEGIRGYCSRLDHFDNQFLTYTVMLHDWLNQPGYAALFMVSFLASTLLPLGSEWLLVMILVGGYD